MSRSTGRLPVGPPPALAPRGLSRRQSRSLTSLVGSRPNSRSSSMSRRGSRQDLAKLDVYSRLSHASSTDRLSSFIGDPVGHHYRASQVKRWDGNGRTTTDWDCIRRDPELWFPAGDCLVHFYERGHSRRGPSLRLPLADLQSSNCGPFLEACCASPLPETPRSFVESSSDDGGYFSNPSSAGKHEMFIPAPAHLNRKEAFQYHLTTRNFFAWMFDKPLVGSRLGSALVLLLERMNEYRPDAEENQDDILAYIDLQGYTDFRECPDHALAALQFAEKSRCSELWTDAFVHCVGMNGGLVCSNELSAVSRTSKALITRAHLEMELRLERAGKALGNFLEDDLSGNVLDASDDARTHLERFRSFLHSFYVQKHGYWPPSYGKSNGALPKYILRAMYFDFRNLYDYLVDPSPPHASFYPRQSGGIRALQAVQAFDRRFKYAPLPQCVPLVPETCRPSPPPRKPRPFNIGRNRAAKLDRRMAILGNLTAATNWIDFRMMGSSLVREYVHFERDWTLDQDERLSSADARKVRWLLIYGILQTLISVTRAPVEVRDTEGVSYPLCCQTAGTPPWSLDGRSAATNTPAQAAAGRDLATATPLAIPFGSKRSETAGKNRAARNSRRPSAGSDPVTIPFASTAEQAQPRVQQPEPAIKRAKSFKPRKPLALGPNPIITNAKPMAKESMIPSQKAKSPEDFPRPSLRPRPILTSSLPSSHVFNHPSPPSCSQSSISIPHPKASAAAPAPALTSTHPPSIPIHGPQPRHAFRDILVKDYGGGTATLSTTPSLLADSDSAPDSPTSGPASPFSAAYTDPFTPATPGTATWPKSPFTPPPGRKASFDLREFAGRSEMAWARARRKFSFGAGDKASLHGREDGAEEEAWEGAVFGKRMALGRRGSRLQMVELEAGGADVLSALGREVMVGDGDGETDEEAVGEADPKEEPDPSGPLSQANLSCGVERPSVGA